MALCKENITEVKFNMKDVKAFQNVYDSRIFLYEQI